MPNNSGRRFDEGGKSPSMPSPDPYVVYGFVAVLLALLAFREVFNNEATFLGPVMYSCASIVFWIITIRKWINKPDEELDFEGIDSLNRGFIRFWMRFWLVVALIGTVGLVFNVLKPDWFMAAFCALLTAFSGYYAHANWQNSREASANNSSAS